MLTCPMRVLIILVLLAIECSTHILYNNVKIFMAWQHIYSVPLTAAMPEACNDMLGLCILFEYLL